MKKDIYSLMMFDEIIDAVDKEAYMKGSNRSQVINDILAEHYGLQTPEQKVQAVLENLETNFENALSIGQLVKNTSIQFGKSLKFKYRPKIRYSYEFIGSGDEKYAVLKVTSRTKSPLLNDHLDQFFGHIVKVEHAHQLTEGCCGNDTSSHKFVREFKKSGGMRQEAQEISEYLTRYLEILDRAMNTYFDDLEHLDDFECILEKLYQEL